MDCSITVKLLFFNLSSCNGFLSPSFPYEGALFELGYRETVFPALAQGRQSWKCEC